MQLTNADEEGVERDAKGEGMTPKANHLVRQHVISFASFCFRQKLAYPECTLARRKGKCSAKRAEGALAWMSVILVALWRHGHDPA